MAFNFGSSTSQPASGFGSTGSTFGASTHNAAGTLFGAGTGQSNSAFGNTSTTNNSSAGTLFGTSSAPGGFGSTSTAGTTGFGSTTTSAPGTGFSFGGTSTGTGFGNTSTTSTGFGTNTNTGFGKTATGFGTIGSTSGGFGTGTITGFGSSTGTGFGTGGGFGFGQQQQLQQQQQQQQPPSTGFNFSSGSGFGSTGATTSSLFGQSQQQQNTQHQSIPGQQTWGTWQKLALCRAQWDPSSPRCQFKHYYYNVVSPTERHLYVRPPNQDEKSWQEAMNNNPDPDTMVPVLAVGYEDNLKRMRAQEQAKVLLQEKLEEATQRFMAIQQQYNLGTMIRLEQQKRQHLNQTRRLIRMLRLVQILRYKGFPLQKDEEKLIQRLKSLAEESESPERLNMALRETFSTLQKYKRERAMNGEKSADSWLPVSQEDIDNLGKMLFDQQEEFRQLAEILQKDLETLETYKISLKNRSNVERPKAEFMALK